MFAPPCPQELIGDDLDEDPADAIGDIFDLCRPPAEHGATADAPTSAPPSPTRLVEDVPMVASSQASAPQQPAPPPPSMTDAERAEPPRAAHDPSERDHQERPPRDGAPMVVYLPEGRIAYYSHDQRFEATCTIQQVRRPDGGVDMCKLTRTSRPSERRRGQGRPLGLALAWLSAAHQHSDKESHGERFWISTCVTKEERVAARRRLKTVENGCQLLECERPPHPGEDSEPDVVP